MKFVTATFFALLISGGFAQARVQLQNGFVIQSIACPAVHSRQIQALDKQVAVRLQELLNEWPRFSFERVRTDFITPENRQWSATDPNNQKYEAHWQTLGQTFQKMLTESRGGIRYICAAARDKTCQDEQINAYVPFWGNRPVKKLVLCSRLFLSTPEHQAKVIFHELSHYAAATDDYAGDWRDKNQLNLARGARDAYYIEGFYSNPSAFVLRNAVWAWLWKKSL